MRKFLTKWYGQWEIIFVGLLSPPAKIAFSSSVAGTSSLTVRDLVFVAFRDAIRNSARVNFLHWPSNFCSNHTTTSTDDFPTQLACPDNRISESCCVLQYTKTQSVYGDSSSVHSTKCTHLRHQVSVRNLIH